MPTLTASRYRRTILALTLFLAVATLTAQVAGKRPLNHKDYDGWRSITSQQLSPDGKFVAYALFPQEGDGEFVLRDLASARERREPIGERPAPPRPDPGAITEEGPPVARGIGISFTGDKRMVVFTTFPPKADTQKAKQEKKRPDEMPRGGLVIMDLTSDAVVRIPRVTSFQIPEKTAAFLAYLRAPAPSAQPASATPAAGAARGRRPGRTREYGSDLVLRKLADGSERTFPDVLEYSFSKDGASLVYAVSSRKEDSNGVYALAVGGDAAPVALLNGRGKYTRITWDDNQTQLAFLSDRDDAASPQAKQKVYRWDRKSSAAAELVSSATPGVPNGWVISDRANLDFSRDGARLFFGTGPPRPPERDAEPAAPADDQVSVDLWHWKDDFIQPMQKVRAEQERNRAYRAVYHIADNKFVQLADRTMTDVTPSDDGRLAVGSNDRPYRAMVEYDTRYADIFLIDTITGIRKPLATKQQGAGTFSPDGKHLLRFDGKDWIVISVPAGAPTNLTARLGVNFFNEQFDSPSTPGSYGSAGWTKDGKSVLLYDQFDVWQLAPDGSMARNVTDGVGRKEGIAFRVVDPDRPRQGPGFGAGGGGGGGRFGGGAGGDDRGIDPAKPLLLRAEKVATRETGFYRDSIGADTLPERLVLSAKNFTAPSKAKEADVLLLTASTFAEFPDLLVTDSSLKSMRKVSDANPQKAQLLWGTSELVQYKNADGVTLQAALYKPDNFDPRRKYPMLVYIYERLSQGVHNFNEPRPGHSINISYYVSNGYLVLLPDIAYTIGYPGASALKCVLPAIQTVVDQGIVNEKAIGIQGHSWGGYQIAYMVTQTNRFRAASAGAPVANMISAYDGIRWGPGLPRQFQYERTQSRIGGSLWQYPMRFIENSPIFMADRVTTPLLMLHNDADDAVPWYQGIEYYLALRRLNREAYLFVYNGEPHGLRRRPNQRDYTVRLQQFFDHYLKGAPKPEWMERGIPYLDREQEKERLRSASDH